MAHAVSAFSDRFERMPVAAVALALLLHGAVAAAIWWANRVPSPPPVEDVIQVSFEPPPTKPPEPPPQKAPDPPRPQAQPQVLPPVEGIRPPADIVADKATQAPPKGDKPKDADLAPPPPPLRDTEPARDTPSQPAQTAMARPEPVAPPAAPSQRPPPPPAPTAPPRAALAPSAPAGTLPRPPEMPPVPAPEKAPDPVLPEPDKAQKHDERKPPAEQKPAATHAPVTPRPPAPAIPQHEAPKYAPSPLSTLPSRKPPAGTQSDNPSPSPFVNPADTYSRARVADNYLWQVVRRLQGYRYSANVNARQGLTVVRVVIARDGRLLDVQVTRSSGYPEFDNGVLQGVRSGSPYAPLPPEIKGDSAAFDLPLMSVNRGG